MEIKTNSKEMEAMEMLATSYARQRRGQVTQALYVPASEARVTKERAYAAMLALM